METTPYTVRPYVIPILFCVVVSTSAIKTQADFASHEIFPTDFNSDDSDEFSVALFQNVIIHHSISIVDPDWIFTNRCALSIFVNSQTPIPIIGRMNNLIDYSDGITSLQVTPHVFYKS
ncbi:MAG: hypothetical protein WBP41_08175 [Saprospiraceae bacterium]